jgi:signal peptidase I
MRPIHIFLLVSAALLLVGLYKTFEKAGEKGWKAFVPVYNFLIWLKIIKKPWWWIFLVLIPTVGFYMLAIMLVLLSNCFGKRKFTDHLLAIFAYFIWVPYLGFSKDVKFTGVPPEEKKRSMLKEWGEAAIFAVVAATLIRTFFFEAFVIPSSSMEGTLLVGDYLFVSKMSYGAKVPSIPLTVPFTHNTLPLTETTPSYLDWVELPYMRLPGFGKVQRNDIVVFNFPEGDTVWTGDRNQSYYQVVRDAASQNNMTTAQVRKQLIDQDLIVIHPVDKEDNYVKRCVAVAGDKVEIKKHILYVNGQKAYMPENLQYGYWVYTGSKDPQENERKKNALEEARLKYAIEKEEDNMTASVQRMGFDHLLQCSEADYRHIKPFCDTMIMNEDTVGQFEKSLNVFPHSPYFRWNKDNFGPLIIPKKGMTVHLSKDSLPLWERIISVYENNKLEIKGDQFFINGEPATTYTFKQDYFWMMGDNRHNSLDSRFWGYVPADHIVGKPVFVWMSKGDETGFRPERMMAFVSKEGLSKSYLWWVIGGIVVIVAFNQYRNRNKPKKGDENAKPGKLKVQTKKK